MDEPSLIAQARNGSSRAFGALVARYRDGLFRFLLSRSPTRADAEDALQDTLLNAYRYLHSYDSRWRFSTWLYRIAIHNALPRRRAPLSSPTLPHETRTPEADPLELAVAADERENLWRVARRTLSDDVYAALWLRYVEDMSMEEIARTLERSVSWSKVNLLRARRTLEAELREPSRGAQHG